METYMKNSMLRLIALILAITASLVGFTDHSKARRETPPDSSFQTTAAAVQEKTVEQVEKNIKVLNGMPASQLIPVMSFFAASMGRRCNFCHVNNNGQWDYASDAKPEKQTAREMIKLVLDNNKTLGRLNLDPIACYTCHRGRTSPQSIPTLPLPLPSPPPAGSGGPGGSPAAATPSAQPQASPNPRPALPSADDIFNKYIEALGGQAAIDKLKSRVAKGTLVQANGNTLQFEVYQVVPDRFYQNVTTPQGAFERGFNGTVGWERTPRGVRELSGGELAQLKSINSLFALIKLKEQLTRTRVGRDKIGDRDVYVVTGTMADGNRQRLFFDMQTGLLLRRVTYMSTMVGIIPDQLDLDDYREVDGVKFPFTAISSTIDVGNPVSTRKFSDIKLNSTVDDSKFNMPPAPKPSTP